MHVTARLSKQDPHPVILFDGFCHLCSHTVRYILRWDRRKRFRYASLSSAYATTLLSDNEILRTTDSILLVDHQNVYMKSSAVLRIIRILGGWHLFVYILVLIPRVIRDWFYDWIASHRYRLFGKYDQCHLPPPDVQKLFIP